MILFLNKLELIGHSMNLRLGLVSIRYACFDILLKFYFIVRSRLYLETQGSSYF